MNFSLQPLTFSLRSLRPLPLLLSTFLGLAAPAAHAQNQGLRPIFDGQSLNGWTLVGKRGPGYVVQNGVIVCPADGGGNLFTEREYADFIFRFEFKLTGNANNGVGIRAPLEGDAAYVGMEIQILHDDGSDYTRLRPEQYHGSIYDLIAAKRGALKKAGEWNEEEIRAEQRRIKVTLNGKVIVDADLNDIRDPAKLQKHPGILRERGHIGFLGHGSQVEFRNLRVQELPSPAPDNQPPAGFSALFNGRDLEGWKGLLAAPNDNPSKRATLSPAELAAAQEKANQRMREHWKAEQGVLVFDGKGDSLATARDYDDFELHVDWKILEKGDSGIYLRGTPQVQIWEPNAPGQRKPPVGSGGLYNNQKNPSDPVKSADKPIGQWNRFIILMTGEKVTVYLNDELVTHNVTLENYWERDKPIYPSGQIELQNHGNMLFFKNLYIRPLSTR